MTITINAGPVNASQDGQGRRLYTWQGRKLLSVTSVPKAAGLPHRLHRWFISNLIGYVVDNASAISLRTSTGDEREVKLLRAELWRAVDGDQNGRILGIAVHRAAAEGHDPSDVHPDIAPRLRQYLDWRQQSGVEILASEFQVWNLTEGYAGTVDLLGRFSDGSIGLVDLKTGEGLYPEMALQLIAYLMAEFVGRDDVVDEDLTAMLRAISRVGILHLTDTGWEYVSLELDAETWTAFRGLLRFASWLTAHAELDPLIGARRRSDGVIWPSAGEPLSGLGWRWARIGNNVAHLVPPNGDLALCMRPVGRPARVELDERPDRVCQRCQRTEEAAA